MIANVTKALSLLCLLMQVNWMLFEDQPADPLRAPQPIVERPLPRYQVLLFTADWCGPCRQDKRALVPHLKRNGLSVSDSNTADVMIVDADEFSGHVEAWRVRALPTYILVETRGETAREIRRHAGRLSTPARFRGLFREMVD